MTGREQRCDTCVFWMRRTMYDGSPAGYGSCHAQPPAVVPNWTPNAVWPCPDEGDWCGKWTLRPGLETP